MLIGILSGLGAALCNSFGYLFSAQFLKHCNNPFRFLIYAHVWMMIIACPFIWFFLPEGGIPDLRSFLTALCYFMVVFFVGQGAFFIALRYFEASKLSSLLGMKIIILTLIYALFKDTVPNMMQLLAILLSAFAAVMINWTGKGKLLTIGWVFVFMILLCYSLSDINETAMVLCVRASKAGLMQSALCVTTIAYTALGILCLPGMFFLKFEKKLFFMTFPYALLWLISQVFLFCCFAMVRPVFGNVVLASRGMFSVILGAVLASLGIKDLDAQISRKQWSLRAVAAFLMIGAIALYSVAAMK